MKYTGISKNMEYPQIIPFLIGFSINFHHSSWGTFTPIFGNIHNDTALASSKWPFPKCSMASSWNLQQRLVFEFRKREFDASNPSGFLSYHGENKTCFFNIIHGKICKIWSAMTNFLKAKKKQQIFCWKTEPRKIVMQHGSQGPFYATWKSESRYDERFTSQAIFQV